MGHITFRPTGFKPGASYYAELLFDSAVVYNEYNLEEFELYEVEVEEPGTYTLKIYKVGDDNCIIERVIQALFPLISYFTSAVDCSNNTYSYIITLLNPETAGINVQYGWSLVNQCSTVTNWSTNTTLILPADDVNRYVFVRNQDVSCCTFISASAESPCEGCNLNVTNIVFTCS